MNAQKRASPEPAILQDFFDLSNEMLCVANEQGYFIQVNASWSRVLGWSEEELCVSPYIDFVHPDDVERTLKEASRLYTEVLETVDFENRYRCKDGGYRWIAWNVARSPDGEHLLAAARDVTVQREQEAALRVSEERLRLVMEVSDEAIWDLDLITGKVWSNLAYTRVFGEPHPNDPNAFDWWVGRIHPDDRNRVVTSIKAAIQQPAEYWSSEYRYLRSDDTYGYVLDRAVVICGEGGRPIRMVGAVLDLTQQKAGEQTIRRLYELQERERKVVAHNIHDGLAQVIIASHMQLEGGIAKISNQQVQQLTRAGQLLSTAIDECKRLINYLRPMVLDERGITDSVKFLIAEWEKSSTCQFQLTSELEAEQFEPLLDDVIFRIIQESVQNGLSHGQATQVGISLHQFGPTLTVTVSDNGQGFVPAQVPANRYGIRGIQERAELFRGQAVVTSQVGQGTTVHVRMQIPGWKRQVLEEDSQLAAGQTAESAE